MDQASSSITDAATKAKWQPDGLEELSVKAKQNIQVYRVIVVPSFRQNITVGRVRHIQGWVQLVASITKHALDSAKVVGDEVQRDSVIDIVPFNTGETAVECWQNSHSQRMASHIVVNAVGVDDS